jgi:hypothetical protein
VISYDVKRNTRDDLDWFVIEFPTSIWTKAEKERDLEST